MTKKDDEFQFQKEDSYESITQTEFLENTIEMFQKSSKEGFHILRLDMNGKGLVNVDLMEETIKS